MIIIEGLDATGKSTLAAAIHNLTGWPIQTSEGPEKKPGEIIDRCHRYLKLPDFTIFDRHPIISQSIYGPVAQKTLIPPYLVNELKMRNPLLIEASPENMMHHVPKEYDSPAHIEMIEQKRSVLAHLYAQFFRHHFPSRLVYKLEFLESIANAALSFTKRRTENVAQQNAQ